MKFTKIYEDCYVFFDESKFVIGNDLIERSWNMKDEFPQSLSLKNKKNGKEWLDNKGQIKDDEITPSFLKASMTLGRKVGTSINIKIDDDFGFAVKHLIAEVEIEYDKARLKWYHIIYPHMPILRTYISCEIKTELMTGEPIKNCDKLENQTIETDINKLKNDFFDEDYVDLLPSLPLHCKWKAVRLKDVTDHHNNLVSTEEGLFYPKEKSLISGNVLFVKDLLCEDGFIFIKEGPTFLAYQGDMSHDFRIYGNNIFAAGWGFTVDELNRYHSLDTYGSAIVLWEGDEETVLISLQQYHRVLHRYVAERDAFVMCNTWGDRSRDGRVNEKFIMRELEIAKSLGISSYQIDDGWQRGITANSIISGGVWEGYHKSNPDFWKVNEERFSNGLGPITKAATAKDIRLGLWFSPDSTDNFANWEKDADILIELHRKYGARLFKLDGIKIRSKKGEQNLFNMMQKVVRETDGKVLFNLDVTAEVRNGYYGRVQYGCLFLENRYTDWHNYYPHWTLRNLWMLSKYYPTFRLQMEFLNVKRNEHLYKGDILAPSVCGIEYAFAVTMFANPLAWMELSNLDEESVKILQELVSVYRKYQAEILSGYILPIGQEPSGTSWTGFQSITGDGKGFFLIIREYNKGDNYNFKLWRIRNKKLRLHKLLGKGNNQVVNVDEEGQVNFCLDGKFQYSLYAYEQIED